MYEEAPKETPPVLDADRLMVIIPECCREGWSDCKHVVNREKKPKRQNPGL